MFAHRSTGHGSASKDTDTQQLAPERSTLTQQLDHNAGASPPSSSSSSPPLFAQGAAWETIEPSEVAGEAHDDAQADAPDPAHEAAMLAYLATPAATAPTPKSGPAAAVDESAIEPTHTIASSEPDAEGEDADAAGADGEHEPATLARAASTAPASADAEDTHPTAPAARQPNAQHTTPAIAAENHLDRKRKGKPFYAHQDALNRGTVHDNHKKGHVKLARPGVTVGKGSKKHDEFTLNGNGTKHRYLIAPNSDGTVAQPHSTVTNKRIKHADGRFAVNPSHVRKLVIPGEEAKGPQDCVLTWFAGAKGAAWMKVSDLHGGTSIAAAANHAANAMNARPGKDAIKDTTPFQVRAGGVASAKSVSENQYIKPHQKSTTANHRRDYLEKGTKKAGGQVNLCMNLPSKHAPPVAIDVLLPGQMFFVPNEKDHKVPSKYVREIAIYGHNANKTSLAEVWVFGFVGKSATEPDESRAGWLPLRVVAPAKIT